MTASHSNPVYQTLIEQMVLPPSSNQGLLMSARDGGTFAFDDAASTGRWAVFHWANRSPD
jgi:hypothetical protein